MSKDNISNEDMSRINTVLDGGKRESIVKGSGGNFLKIKKDIVNSAGVAIRNYSGKILKHRKMYIDDFGVQHTACDAGDKFDDIPIDLRNKVQFNDHDFVN